MDGVGPLPDKNAKACEYRDELACARLQSEACHEHTGHQAANPGDAGVGLYLPCKTGVLSTSQVFSQRELLDRLPWFGRATTENNRPDGFENVRGCLTDDH